MEQPAMEMNPEKLSTLCLDAIAMNLEGTIARRVAGAPVRLALNVPFLSEEISQDIISAYAQEGLPLTDEVMHMFKERDKTRLSCIDLRGSQVTDSTLDWLYQQPLKLLNISHCNGVSCTAVRELIDKQAPNLKRLMLGEYPEILLKTDEEVVVKSMEQSSDNSMEIGENQTSHNDKEYTSNSKRVNTELLGKLAKSTKLRAFSLHKQVDKVLAAPFSNFLGSLKHIQYLDLSECASLVGDQQDLQPLKSLQQLSLLSSLILHKVIPDVSLQICLPVLTKFKTLRHLDISSAQQTQRRYEIPSTLIDHGDALQQLVSELPLLCSLDISGTCLVGPDEKGEIYMPIPALQGRHFEFLGLLNCWGKPDRRRELPAAKVAGSDSIAQVSVALKVYQYRSSFVEYCLNVASSLLPGGWSEEDEAEVLNLPELICHVLDIHPSTPLIQGFGSQAIYYIITNFTERPNIRTYSSSRLLRKIVRTLMTAARNHEMVRSTVMNVLQHSVFQIPEDMWFMYKEVIHTLLQIIQSPSDRRASRNALFLMLRMLRPVNGEEKKTAGDCGTVEVMLRMIDTGLNYRHIRHVAQVLDLYWAVLLYATDNVPVNSARFLYKQGDTGYTGLTLFMDCYLKFFGNWRESQSTDHQNLIWYMTRVLANVSEVASLRPQLAQPELLSLFRELLSPSPSALDVSHNAASIICNILSDSEQLPLYTPSSANQITASDSSHNQLIDQPTEASMCAQEEESDVGVQVQPPNIELNEKQVITREGVLDTLAETVNGWKIDKDRRLVYQSLHPVLGLLQCNHTVEIRLWACWELCNFTTIKATTYCPMLVKEGGVELIQDIMSNPQVQTGDVMSLASTILSNLEDFREGRVS